MAAAVLGSTPHGSLWDAIKDEKYGNGDTWGSSSGSGWGTAGWDENGGWGSGTGKQGEWGSGEGGWRSSGGGWGSGWGSGMGEGGWGLTGGAWANGGSSGGGPGKQATLTDFWSGGNGEKSSAPQGGVEREPLSSTGPHVQAEPDRKSDGSTGWGTGSSGWGTGAGTSNWAETTGGGGGTGKTKEDAGIEVNANDALSPLFSPVLYSKSPELSTSGAPASTSSDVNRTQSSLRGQYAGSIDHHPPRATQPGASASALYPSSQPHGVPQADAFPQSYFISLGDGSSEYRPYPTTYDIRATWEANYAGHYNSMDFSAIPSMVEESMDRNLERYYWDLRYQSEIPNPSPYVQEMRNLSAKYRELFIHRLAHLDFMFSRVERKLHPITASVSGTHSRFQSPSSSSKDFLSQRGRNVKQTVYKALRLLYKEWHDGAEYPSVLDWEGDHSMPYRVGPMI